MFFSSESAFSVEFLHLKDKQERERERDTQKKKEIKKISNDTRIDLHGKGRGYRMIVKDFGHLESESGIRLHRIKKKRRR